MVFQRLHLSQRGEFTQIRTYMQKKKDAQFCRYGNTKVALRMGKPVARAVEVNRRGSDWSFSPIQHRISAVGDALFCLLTMLFLSVGDALFCLLAMLFCLLVTLLPVFFCCGLFLLCFALPGRKKTQKAINAAARPVLLHADHPSDPHARPRLLRARRGTGHVQRRHELVQQHRADPVPGRAVHVGHLAAGVRARVEPGESAAARYVLARTGQLGLRSHLL